jgi:hypothetical protein
MARLVHDTGATHVVHEHHDGESGNGAGFLLGVILLLVVAFLFLYYGLPAIRTAAAPQVNVPGQLDVNVNKE